MKYWLDLFTGTTWKEFRDAGARVSGFRKRMARAGAKVKAGDVLLCYLTGVKRWVGALEVIGFSNDRTRIWKDEEFPVRFEVKPLVLLDPEYGVPMDQLQGRVDFFKTPRDLGKYKGFVRMSPNSFRQTRDGELILDLLRAAENRPVARPVDPKKLARKPFFRAETKRGKRIVPAVVSVPESEEASGASVAQETSTPTLHTEIEHRLLQLGAEMGLDVWVAKNDRSKLYDDTSLGQMPGMVNELPTQFNEATTRTIEMIDVLWLKGNSIVAAFEVESTTSVYSGLLRMSDLLALQPNLDIKLYLVAPDDRRNKVEQELLRPTFKLRERPLPEACGFIPFSRLTEVVEGIRKLGLASSLRPDFLSKTAEYFSEEQVAEQGA